MIRDHVIYGLYMVIAFLLPLVPAYFLYKSLPSKTVVKGPFKGLNLQLSGAFAGYFLLVLIMQGLILLRPKPQPPFEVYQVQGQLRDVPENILQDIVDQMVVRPEFRPTYADGRFSFHIVVSRDQETGEMSFPSLQIKHVGYHSASVPLHESTQDYEIDRVDRLIKIKTVIALTEAEGSPAYAKAQ